VASSYHKMPAPASPKAARRATDSPATKREEYVHPLLEPTSTNAPGMLARKDQGGFFGGTALQTHLFNNSDSKSEEEITMDDPLPEPIAYDTDLLGKLPPSNITEALLTHYFTYCTWQYRHVNEPAFRTGWNRFANGNSSNRLVLATALVIMALALQYLPPQHPILEAFPSSREGTAQQLYATAKIALRRHMEESRVYTLELVELMLVRTHYLAFIKTEPEEMWHVTGELVTMGKAMGLHRDPDKWSMPQDVAERRRWAWWHIILLERWQSFLFGRPISIASHHFDTGLPMYVDPAIDETGRIFLPNLALFRLAHILGDIVDKALAVHPISYDSVRANDRALQDWYHELPQELLLDEYRTARGLSSDDTATKRFAVQSVIVRASYYHIRFTLHRPYASLAHSIPSHVGKGPVTDPVKCAQSLEIAVSSAEKVINLAFQSGPDITSISLPGHMNWGGFHCFSAAMFFSFQLLANPDQPGASLFRDSINKAMTTLHHYRGSDVADKGYEILSVLSPLYSTNFDNNVEAREKAKSHVLKTVRKLAFPYQDDPHKQRRGDTSSPHSQRSYNNSPAHSAGPSASPPVGGPGHGQAQFESFPGPHMVSSMRTTSNQPGVRPSSAVYGNDMVPSPLSGGPHSTNGNNHSPAPRGINGHIQPSSAPGQMGPPPPPYLPQQQHQHQQQMYDQGRMHPYNHSQSVEWGASSGLEQGEWAQLMNVLQPHRHSSGFHSQLS
jgi:hypothetical protein